MGKKIKVEEEAIVSMKQCVEQVKKIATTRLADVEEPLVIKEEWVVQVRKMLHDKNYEVALPRVATALKNVNPEAYIPRFISLGPYHHWKLKRDIASSARGTFQSGSLKISTAEAYKVKSAAALSQRLPNHGKSFQSIIAAIERKRSDIEQFYDWKIKEGENYSNFALMMAVDSTFLLCFLFSLFTSETAGTLPSGSSRPEDDMSNFSALQPCIKCDILKLENQVPFSVLKEVFENVKEALSDADHERQFPYLLKKTYTVLSPFDVSDIDSLDTETVAERTHLLDCMQAMVSPFLDMKADIKGEEPDLPLFQKLKLFLEDVAATVCGIFIRHPSKTGHHDFLNAYNAGQLDKAGIKFQSFSDPQQDIRFDKYSETLYLPRITVSHIHTEVFLRNMVALEFNDPARRNSVTRYVGLMDCLIDTPNDVSLLRDSDVIRRRSLMLTDEYVAKMWDGMCQPFFTGHLELPEEIKETLREVLIKKYYKSKIKSALLEFYEEYLSRPWKVIALFIGFCVLVVTVLEGYCTFYKCTRQPENP